MRIRSNFLVQFLLICFACSSEQSNQVYKVDINYEKIAITPSSYQQSKMEELSQVVHLFFENGFENNTLFLTVNDQSQDPYQISTDERLGLAKQLEIGNVEDVKSITIRIDEGAVAELQLSKGYNVITVNLVDGILKINFVDGFPSYY